MLYFELDMICSTRERISESRRLIAKTKNLIRGTAARIHASRLAAPNVAASCEHIAFEQLWPKNIYKQAD